MPDQVYASKGPIVAVRSSRLPQMCPVQMIELVAAVTLRVEGGLNLYRVMTDRCARNTCKLSVPRINFCNAVLIFEILSNSHSIFSIKILFV